MPVCHRELAGLTSCVKAAVHGRCGQTASQLVDVLVRSSVQLSPMCTADMMSQTYTAVTTVTHSSSSSNNQTSRSFVIILGTMLTFMSIAHLVSILRLLVSLSFLSLFSDVIFIEARTSNPRFSSFFPLSTHHCFEHLVQLRMFKQN